MGRASLDIILQWALDRRGVYEDLVVPMSADAPAKRRSGLWWQLYEPPYGAELHSTNFVAERTIDFINESAAAGEPWMAWASFPDPHHPMTPPGEWYDKYNPADMELSASINDPLANAPSYLRRIQRTAAADQPAWPSPFGAIDHDLVREAQAATYSSIEFIDDGVGRMLGAVEALGQLDNTIVVFTADHGDMNGDHGLMLKGFIPFRGKLQVPMLIVDPRRNAARSTSLASSIDLGPTLMDLCNVSTHDGTQGVPLTPALDGSGVAVRDHVLVEDDLRPAFAKLLRVPHRI